MSSRSVTSPPPFPQPEPAPTLWTLSCAHCSFQGFVLEGHLGSLCSLSLPVATQPIRRVNTNMRTFCEAKNLQGLVWESRVSHRSNSDLVHRSRAVENCPGNTHLLCFDFEYNINVSYITYSSYCTGGRMATGAHLPQVHTTPTVTLPDEHIKSPIGPLVGSLLPNRWFLETTDLSLYLFLSIFPPWLWLAKDVIEEAIETLIFYVWLFFSEHKNFTTHPLRCIYPFLLLNSIPLPL